MLTSYNEHRNCSLKKVAGKMSNFGQQWGKRGKGEKLRGPSFWLGALITARRLDISEHSPFFFLVFFYYSVP